MLPNEQAWLRKRKFKPVVFCRRLPNTYEAPVCQGTKEVRRKIKGLPLLGSRSVDRAWCDRLDFQLGFCRDAVQRVLHQTPIEGPRPTADKALALWSGGSVCAAP